MVGPSTDDRRSQLQSFDDTKAGVKGLLDAGIQKLPEIFINTPEITPDASPPADPNLVFPAIDLHGIEQDPASRSKVVERVRQASESWGFFQVVNHGIPESTLAEMLAGVRRFNEQETEIKQQYYRRDDSKRFWSNSNFDLFSAPSSNWRDSFYCLVSPEPPQPEELPAVCRDILLDYSEQVMLLGKRLLELLSEGLGLSPNHLLDLEIAESLSVIGHYYPPCPEPKLTLGITKHSDNNFVTILLQDSLGGLQVMHNNHWVNVTPIQGALIINMGDLMQLVTNDKFKSVEHRVLANSKGPRVSFASFFGRTSGRSTIVHSPIKELLSDENSAKYRSTTADEFTRYFIAKGLDGTSALQHFRIQRSSRQVK